MRGRLGKTALPIFDWRPSQARWRITQSKEFRDDAFLGAAMPVIIRNTGLVYVAVPKIACTSIKMAILAHNDPQTAELLASDETSLDQRGVHAIYGSSPLRLLHIVTRRPFRKWFALVRDPLRRFVSGYRNRILHHHDLEKTPSSVWEQAGLSPEPTIDEFASKLGEYSALNEATQHHFDPMTVFLGRRPGLYDRIFCISEIGEVGAYMAAHGGPLEIPHEQTGGPKMTVDDLSAESVAALRAFYADDYRIWGSFIRESDGTGS